MIPIATSAERLTQEWPAAAYTAVGVVSEAVNIPQTEFGIVSAERANWPDACFGMPTQGETCAQQLAPGWRVLLEAQGNRYAARTNEMGPRRG